MYICIYVFFRHGSQWLPPGPRIQFGHLPMTAPPAKSGPISSLYTLHSMEEHLSTKLQGICTSASTGMELSVCTKDVANVPHKAGGYSLSTNVRNFPSIPCPMLAPLGKSSTTRQDRICWPRVGRFSDSSIVGLAEIAPKRPCANSHRWKPGSCSNKLIKGVFQMDADVSLGGLAGCSRAPHPPMM